MSAKPDTSSNSSAASPEGAPAPRPEPDDGHGHGHGHGHASTATLALAALGVVFGDIGTSPLYALKECIQPGHGVSPTPANVLGLLSLMLWSVVLVVSVKYLAFIMRADNEGEGGILALLALLPESPESKLRGRLGVLSALVLFGAALLYGDGMITPAISVLSAVEGLDVATDAFRSAVVPLTVVILLGLFAVQRRGTATIGRVFGPVMVVWFLTLAGLGAAAIAKNPVVLQAVSPLHAIDFFRTNGFHGFVVLGSVVLCITGGEALYADMGHFGRRPIQLAWYVGVLPALVVNYFGQGALLLGAEGDALAELSKNPFYGLVPRGPAVYPLVLLATAATIIASQALISGAYSLTRQAVQLGFLPRVTVTHTSKETEGQIFIPEINTLLAVGCVVLVLVFQASTNLAAAYGIAVTGTMGITSIAFGVVAHRRWGWSLGRVLPLVGAFLAVDLAFFGSNLLKFFHGGFVPIVVAVGIFFTMAVWKRGRALLAGYFARASTPLDAFLDQVGKGTLPTDDGEEPLARVPGAAVFLTSNPTGTPPLLLHHARHNKALHRVVVLVTVSTERVPRVRRDRIAIEALEHGFVRLRVRVGFMETPDVPRALAVAARAFHLPIDPRKVTYYLGRETLLATSQGEMGQRAEQLFAFLSRNSQNATRYFGIPPERVVEIGMQVDL